ncbi:outer membrane beta-barrel protein [Sphingobacterium anhuiense]|uniref:outer membrane beta-barrel protein n=1 Tax=Sphingobacterium anhuiense TaxID=493780 RepID=UPI003C30B47A
MAKFYWSILLLCSFMLTNATHAQTKVSGEIVDSKDGGKLGKAAVVLLNAKDSVLVKFVRTNENGSFSFPKIDTGTYRFIVSFPQYVDVVKDVTVGQEPIAFGTIKLSKAALLLEEAQVTGRIPVVIKGDTIEYDAGSFKVEKDAKVEDLLKVLPGMTMDANGKITANGKEVKKVLLDGEEFFGDDPTLITKNIRSDMVSKVQVYEKKSDLADRTGVDDGERTQTIDIKLKADSKKGMFGQATVGGGTDNYYGGKVMVNKFKGSQKIAVYGIAANDGMVGLGFEDGQKYGVGSSNVEVMDGGGIMISGGDGSEGGFDGRFYGGGVPKALNFGASYSDKTANDKHKINVNFKRNQLNVTNTSTYSAQNNLPEQARIDNSVTSSDNETKTNGANLRYDYKLDSLTDMTVKMGFNKSQRDNFSETFADQKTLEGQGITETYSKNNSRTEQDQLNLNLLLTRRFKKVRRSLTLAVNTNTDQNNSNTNYFSSAYLFKDDRTDTIDQFKRNKNKNTNLGASLTFTEPLSKKLTGSIGYSFLNNRSETLNQSFDKDSITGEYTVLDLAILNDFDFTSTKNGLSTSLNYKDSKLTVNLSNQLDFEDVKREYNNLTTVLQRNQTSIRPTLSANYNLTKSKSVYLRYSGRTIQPSLTQIEPLKQNSQQLVTYLDNFDLKAGFSNNYSVEFNSYKQLKDQSIYVYLNGSQGINNISTKVTYYEDGRQDIQSVNIDKANWSIYGGSGYRFVVHKKWGLNLNLGANLQYNSQYSYLSLGKGEPSLNQNESWSLAPNIGFNRSKANKLDFYLSVSPGVENLSSSLQPELSRTSFKMNTFGRATYYLPKEFKISIEGRQNYQSATQTLQSINIVNMNGFISKKFLKDKSLEAQLFVNDIFNKNSGINRYQSGSSFIQSSNEVLRRYGMLKVIYNFTTMKGGK